MPELQTEEKPRFEITDLGSLNWVFREQLIPLKAEIERNNALAAAEMERVKKWLDEVNRGPLDSVKYFEHLVQDYHHRLLLQDPKQKTLSTPYGKSKSRASKASPEQVDKDSLTSYIVENGLDEFIKNEVKWGDYKKTLSIAEVDGVQKVFDGTGQEVPGVIVKPESIGFSVEITD